MKKVLILGFSLFILVAAAFFGILSRSEKRHRYLIPESYEGWVCIDYLVDGAGTFPIEDGFELISISPEGMAATSSMFSKTGEGYIDEHFFYNLKTRQRLSSSVRVGGGATIGKMDHQKNEYETFRNYFWVGRPEKSQQWAESHKGVDIVCGPVKESTPE